MVARLVLFLSLLAVSASAQAHELRPAYLVLTETQPAEYSILWKVPARGQASLSLDVRLPGNCVEAVEPAVVHAADAAISRWHAKCEGGLAGRELFIDGLSATFTDVIVRVVRADSTVQTARLSPDFPRLEVTASPSTLDTARTYFLLGVQHIMQGVDHLLFVLALLLLIGSVRTLVATITAFTVAHSITLGFAALGLAAIPQAPVEAAVALSIVFVAAEVIRKQRGENDFSSRYPWVIAFAFGLLHGFGFGGALREIGLPQKDVPLALLTFNLGVEAGQLLFIALAVAAVASAGILYAVRSGIPRYVTAYAIGSVSAAWFVQRIASF